MAEREGVLDQLFDGLITAVISGRRVADSAECRQVRLRPIVLKGGQAYQFEYRYAQKVSHKNLSEAEAKQVTAELLKSTFRQGDFYTEGADFRVHGSESGHVQIKRSPPTRAPLAPVHDRPKNYLIPENEPCPFLHRLGVMSATGRVLPEKRDKYRQINRFLEMVADIYENLPAQGAIRIIDFGCGKSYLTFALHYYLTAIKGRDVEITGLDLKREVIENCQVIAADLDCSGLRFAVEDISTWSRPVEGDTGPGPDLVVSLHACDTATDFALAHALAGEARVILCAPCCQHELFDQVQNDVMRPLLKHGIVKERLAALITDSARAALLEAAGYSVQILEFIDMEHTPKNLLIRAVRKPNARNSSKASTEYRAFIDFWHAKPTLERLLDLSHPTTPIEMSG